MAEKPLVRDEKNIAEREIHATYVNLVYPQHGMVTLSFMFPLELRNYFVMMDTFTHLSKRHLETIEKFIEQFINASSF